MAAPKLSFLAMQQAVLSAQTTVAPAPAEKAPASWLAAPPPPPPLQPKPQQQPEPKPAEPTPVKAGFNRPELIIESAAASPDRGAAADAVTHLRVQLERAERSLAEERRMRSEDARQHADLIEEYSTQLQLVNDELGTEQRRQAKLEARIHELSRQLEVSKHRESQLERQLTDAQTDLERERISWQNEQQRLVGEAEADYTQLYSSVASKAEQTIAALRTELRESMRRSEMEKQQMADASEQSLRTLEDNHRRAVQRLQEVLGSYRSQLESLQASADSERAHLMSMTMERIRAVEDARVQFEREVEEAAQATIADARQEIATLRAELTHERSRFAHLELTLRSQSEAAVKGFESRLRAKVSAAVAELRKKQSQQQAGSTLTLSPLLRIFAPETVEVPPIPAAQPLGNEGQHHSASSQASSATSAASAPGPASSAQPARSPAQADSPRSAEARATPQRNSPSERRMLHFDDSTGSSFSISSIPSSANVQTQTHAPVAAAAASPELPAAEASSPDVPTTAAEDPLPAVLAIMSKEEIATWRELENRLRLFGGT
jgi:hypothetical protein